MDQLYHGCPDALSDDGAGTNSGSEATPSCFSRRFRNSTDGITASPDEVQAEFRRENEKVKLDYVVIKRTTL